MEEKIIKCWTVEDWENGKVIVNNIQLRAADADSQSQIRTKKLIGYQKPLGRVIYYDTDFEAYLAKSRVNPKR